MQTTTTPGTTTDSTTTQTTSTTMATPTLPPNFCRTSADCGIGACCRDMNNLVIVMSEVFDATGPYSSRTARNGTCTPQLAQLGERCNDFCGCETGMTCFRDVNKPCCEPAVCQLPVALEKNVQLWMRCFEDDKCEVYEDDSSEEDDSDESSNNSTTLAVRKFRVPQHLVPTVKTIIAKQNDDGESDESEDDGDKNEFAKLLNSSFIQNLTSAIINDDSEEDSSSEENELAVLLQRVLNDLLNTTKQTGHSFTTTPSPSTTESLLKLFYSSQQQTKKLPNTKNLALKNFVDLKQVNQEVLQSQRGLLFNAVNNQQPKGQNLLSLMNRNVQRTNIENIGLLGSFPTGNMNIPQIQQDASLQSSLDPLTAIIAESIASQLQIPTPMPPIQAAVSGMQSQGLLDMHHTLPSGGQLNINVNQGVGLSTTTAASIIGGPDLTFLASNINPNTRLASKLQRLQLLLASKKSKAAIPPTMQPSTSPIPQIPPMSNLMPTVPANNQHVFDILNSMKQAQMEATTQSPVLSNLSKANAAKAKQAMELLQILKIKKANRRLKKAKKSRKIISFKKSIVNSLSKKDSKTRKAMKQLQALRMSKGFNSTLIRLKSKSINYTRIEEDDDDTSESFEKLKVGSKNETDNDDSDESDEDINRLLAEILVELGNATRPTTLPTTTSTQTTSTTTSPSTTTTETTTFGSTTPISMAMKNILFQNHINVFHDKLARQNALRTKKVSQVTKQPLDLKSLSWNDVVNYFNAKRMG